MTGSPKTTNAPRALGQSAAWTVTTALAFLAFWVQPKLGTSHLVPSASVIALALGIAFGALPLARARFGAGAKAVSKLAIPVSIVLIGFGLDLGPILKSGTLGPGLGLVLIAMLAAFAAALLFGRLLGLDPRASLLLGAGTAVCGNSAIMAVAPTVQAKDEDLGLAIGVINLLGVLMLFVLPPAARLVGIEGVQGGSLAGLSVHAVPQAIATGEAFGHDAIEWATLFKLLRVAMLVPVVVVLAFALARVRGSKSNTGEAGVPWFVVLFVAAAGARALGLVDVEIALDGRAQPLHEWLKIVGRVALAVALTAIGIGIDVRALVRVGPRMLLAGALTVGAMVAVLMPLVRWWL